MAAMAGYVCVMFLLLGVFGVQCFPWEPSNDHLPICTSYDKLCDLTHKFYYQEDPNNPIMFPSSEHLCRCPGGKQCSDKLKDATKVVYEEPTVQGMTVRTQLSYCDAEPLPERVCDDQEVAVTLRGAGLIITEIVGGIKCRCPKPLTLVKAEPDGVLTLRHYACGLKKCKVNSSTPPVCERVTDSQHGSSKISEMLCQCPSGFECYVDPSALSRKTRGVVQHTCQDMFGYF